MPEFSARVQRTELAATFAMAARARALKAQGHDVISLSLGEPDFATPGHIVEAAYQAGLRGETKYPPLGGTEALREAVRKKYARDQKLEVRNENILITNGGKQAIFNVVMAVVQGGADVVIPAPAGRFGCGDYAADQAADFEFPEQSLRCRRRCRGAGGDCGGAAAASGRLGAFR
jgi:aspartate aminotransferase